MLEYATDLFDEPTAAVLAEHLARTLRAVAEDPGQRIGDVRLRSERDESRLAEYNDTAVPRVAGGLIHERYTEQARRTPDRIAVSYEEERLSYAALDARADALAHRLVAAGVPRDGAVGILSERTPHLLVAVLAVLKCGAAYVPLDPRLPQARIRMIMEDVSARVLVTGSAHLDAASVGRERAAGVRVLSVDDTGDGAGTDVGDGDRGRSPRVPVCSWARTRRRT